MTENPLLAITIAIWCLIGLLLVVGIREIIKLQPRTTKTRRSVAPDKNTRGLEKYEPVRAYYMTVSSRPSVKLLYVGTTTTDNARRAWEHRATRLRHVEARPSDTGIRVEHKRASHRGKVTDWMKKHDEVFPIPGEI